MIDIQSRISPISISIYSISYVALCPLWLVELQPAATRGLSEFLKFRQPPVRSMVHTYQGLSEFLEFRQPACKIEAVPAVAKG